jgi:hypothetical protein
VVVDPFGAEREQPADLGLAVLGGQVGMEPVLRGLAFRDPG